MQFLEKYRLLKRKERLFIYIRALNSIVLGMRGRVKESYTR